MDKGTREGPAVNGFCSQSSQVSKLENEVCCSQVKDSPSVVDGFCLEKNDCAWKYFPFMLCFPPPHIFLCNPMPSLLQIRVEIIDSIAEKAEKGL